MQTQNNIFAALGLHTAKMLIIKYVTWRFVVALLHCAPYSGNNLCDVCLRHLPSFALFRSPVRFLWGSVTLYPLLFSFCLSALSHFHFCSSFSHLVDDSLVFESCVFCSMICSVVSLLLPGLSLFFLLLLLHPGSQPNLTYVSASDVLINNCTMLTIMLNSSRPLLVTPRDPFELFPSYVSLSIPLYALLPMAGLPGTGLLYAGRDRGLTCQSLGETARVSGDFTVFNLQSCVTRMAGSQCFLNGSRQRAVLIWKFSDMR